MQMYGRKSRRADGLIDVRSNDLASRWTTRNGVVVAETGRGVRIDGVVVHRPAHRWTPTVHALLQHLQATGLNCAPTPIGRDDAMETVSFLPGASGADCWPLQATDAGLRSAARLLRRVHDATRGWSPPPWAQWAVSPQAVATVVCHGDPGPWNMVWNGTEAVGLIDWDLAYPGPAIEDIAYALEFLAPFRSDEEALRWHGFNAPPDRRRRVQVFADAYGIDDTRDLVDAVIARQARTITLTAGLAEEGIQPQQQWVVDGHLETLRDRVRWSKTHRHLVDP